MTRGRPGEGYGLRARLAALGAVALGSIVPHAAAAADDTARRATVYRCGDASWSQRPCGDGRPIALPAGARSAAQIAEARQVALRERRLGSMLEADRLGRERAVHPTPPGRLDRTVLPAPAPTPPRPVDASRRRARRAGGALDPKNFIVVAPLPPR